MQRSLPSNYLYPLAQNMPSSRSIIFYDQIGCGRSSQPEDEEIYSIESSVGDLDELVKALQLKSFHLLGHSFGGILAYEFAKSKLADGNAIGIESPYKCLSLILANTPCNMQTSLDECARLEEEIKVEMTSLKTLSKSDSVFATAIKDRLRKRYECRTQDIPEPLVDAIKNRGVAAWSGPEAVCDYVAHSPLSQSCDSAGYGLPSVLLIRGEFDFITDDCTAGWRSIFTHNSTSRCNAYREEIMQHCAHYCHLEDGQTFGDLVKNHCFINDY
eukprot:scaffold933_cov190-Alexandrium_tamarense.AAC.15